MEDLTPAEAAVLAIAKRFENQPHAAPDAAHAELGLSLTRYHQALQAVLEKPAALATEPVLVKRLRRLRDQRRRQRSATRLRASRT